MTAITAFGSLLTVLAGLLRDLAQLAVSPSALTVLAGAVLAGAAFAAVFVLLTSVAGLARATAAIPLLRRARALREKSWRAAFLRQRDPDAAGRARPRAPSAAPAAACPPDRGSSRPLPAHHQFQLEGRITMLSIFGVPVDAAYSLVSGFTGILTPVLGGLAAVAAIIAFTMAVRVLLMPLSLRALRGQAAQARLAPQLQALRQRYARQPEKLQKEMSALYKQEGTSMFAGFGPLLLQWPFLSVMYLLFRSPQVGGKTNTLLTRDLFGVPLGTHWLSGPGILSAQGAVFLGVFALLAGLCWLSARLARRWTPSPAARPRPAIALAKCAVGKRAPARAKAAPADQAVGAAQPPQVPGGALVKALPYLTVVIAAFAPLAAGLYLITSTVWSLAERALWRSRRSPASDVSEVKADLSPDI